MMLPASELFELAERLWSGLSSCTLCRHECGADRLSGELGRCHTGPGLEVSSTCVHRGEEPVLTGGKGVGNVFLAHCNLHCVYCQNWQISQTEQRFPCSAERLAERLLEFQELGCPSAGFVSPTHQIPAIVRAVATASERGFRLPLIYNTNSYDSLWLIKSLRGVFDIYLPDFRYTDDEHAGRLSGAEGYREAALENISEMFDQAGEIRTREEAAVSGVLVRLLVLPNGISGTEEALRLLAREVSEGISVSLMAQYNPVYRAKSYPEIARRLRPDEYGSAVEAFHRHGLNRGYVQDLLLSPDAWLPDFEREDPFGE